MGFGLRSKEIVKKKTSLKKIIEGDEKKPPKRRAADCVEFSTGYLYRRAFSEVQLLDVTPALKEGYSYNYITAGDVDSLSYLKIILREQNLEYCLFSTWCMAAEDILQFDTWLSEGRIKKT